MVTSGLGTPELPLIPHLPATFSAKKALHTVAAPPSALSLGVSSPGLGTGDQGLRGLAWPSAKGWG